MNSEQYELMIPTSAREQLRALLPYAVARSIGISPCGERSWSITFRFPEEIFKGGSLDENFLRKHGLSLEIAKQGREYNAPCGPTVFVNPYIEAVLSYN